jgi:pSer/pThr/pTyr-binding forkhead associated (FHA) protein
MFIEDLGSRNGVLLNGSSVVGRQRCTHGDRVTVGSQEIVVIDTQKVPDPRHQRAPNVTLGGDMATPLKNISETEPEGPALRVTQEISRADVARAVARVEQHRSEGREEPTRKADALQMLGGLADKALALGRAEEAERILSQLLHHTLSVAKTGTSVTPERADLVARYAVKLADATGKGSWVDLAIELYTAERRILPAPVVDELYTLLRRVNASLTLLRAYLVVLRAEAGDFGPAERFLLQRVEGLERLAASR